MAGTKRQLIERSLRREIAKVKAFIDSSTKACGPGWLMLTPEGKRTHLKFQRKVRELNALLKGAEGIF